MKQKLGFLFSVIMALYFLISGSSVLLDISGKLRRIDLQAMNTDGEIAFILIYSGLMVGIGVASLLMLWLGKSWYYPVLLTTCIISSFILFRLIGGLMAGFLSSKQLGFLAFEIVEVLAGLMLLRNEKPLRHH